MSNEFTRVESYLARVLLCVIYSWVIPCLTFTAQEYRYDFIDGTKLMIRFMTFYLDIVIYTTEF
jgi:hypothetical protein